MSRFASPVRKRLENKPLVKSNSRAHDWDDETKSTRSGSRRRVRPPPPPSEFSDDRSTVSSTSGLTRRSRSRSPSVGWLRDRPPPKPLMKGRAALLTNQLISNLNADKEESTSPESILFPSRHISTSDAVRSAREELSRLKAEWSTNATRTIDAVQDIYKDIAKVRRAREEANRQIVEKEFEVYSKREELDALYDHLAKLEKLALEKGVKWVRPPLVRPANMVVPARNLALSMASSGASVGTSNSSWRLALRQLTLPPGSSKAMLDDDSVSENKTVDSHGAAIVMRDRISALLDPEDDEDTHANTLSEGTQTDVHQYTPRRVAPRAPIGRPGGLVDQEIRRVSPNKTERDMHSDRDCDVSDEGNETDMMGQRVVAPGDGSSDWEVYGHSDSRPVSRSPKQSVPLNKWVLGTPTKRDPDGGKNIMWIAERVALTAPPPPPPPRNQTTPQPPVKDQFGTAQTPNSYNHQGHRNNTNTRSKSAPPSRPQSVGNTHSPVIAARHKPAAPPPPSHPPPSHLMHERDSQTELEMEYHPPPPPNDPPSRISTEPQEVDSGVYNSNRGHLGTSPKVSLWEPVEDDEGDDDQATDHRDNQDDHDEMHSEEENGWAHDVEEQDMYQEEGEYEEKYNDDEDGVFTDDGDDIGTGGDYSISDDQPQNDDSILSSEEKITEAIDRGRSGRNGSFNGGSTHRPFESFAESDQCDSIQESAFDGNDGSRYEEFQKIVMRNKWCKATLKRLSHFDPILNSLKRNGSCIKFITRCCPDEMQGEATVSTSRLGVNVSWLESIALRLGTFWALPERTFLVDCLNGHDPEGDNHVRWLSKLFLSCQPQLESKWNDPSPFSQQLSHQESGDDYFIQNGNVTSLIPGARSANHHFTSSSGNGSDNSGTPHKSGRRLSVASAAPKLTRKLSREEELDIEAKELSAKRNRYIGDLTKKERRSSMIKAEQGWDSNFSRKVKDKMKRSDSGLDSVYQKDDEAVRSSMFEAVQLPSYRTKTTDFTNAMSGLGEIGTGRNWTGQTRSKIVQQSEHDDAMRTHAILQHLTTENKDLYLSMVKSLKASCIPIERVETDLQLHFPHGQLDDKNAIKQAMQLAGRPHPSTREVTITAKYLQYCIDNIEAGLLKDNRAKMRTSGVQKRKLPHWRDLVLVLKHILKTYGQK